jgi:7-carboxy-7-deazaguanine synthase
VTVYFVNEVFDSLQGEGYHTGKRATFIRLQGCSVGCPWCDSGPDADKIWGRQTNGLTRNTWGKGGIKMDMEQILGKVTQQHVVITGGEPTLYNLDELIQGLDAMGCYTQLETSGQQWFKGQERTDWITWSPKGMLNWNAPDQIFEKVDEVKFVVEPDLEYATVLRAIKYVESIQKAFRRHYFYFMPEGTPPKNHNISYAMLLMDRLIADRICDPDIIRFGDRLQYRLGIR